MGRKASLAILVSLLMVFVPALPAAAPEAVGRVTANGVAEVNGVTVASEATVFPGDHVRTAAKSVASLVLSAGNRVILPATSSVTVQRKGNRDVVVLEHGALAVLARSNSPATIEAGGTRVIPVAGQPAVIEVALEGNMLKVMSRRGAASVVASNKTLEVASGKELDASLAPAQGEQGSGTGTASAIMGSKWLQIGALAAGLTGLGLGAAAYANSQNPSDCKVVSATGKITCP